MKSGYPDGNSEAWYDQHSSVYESPSILHGCAPSIYSGTIISITHINFIMVSPGGHKIIMTNVSLSATTSEAALGSEYHLLELG